MHGTVGSRGTAAERGRAAVANKIHLEGPLITCGVTATLTVLLAVALNGAGVEQEVQSALRVGSYIVVHCWVELLTIPWKSKTMFIFMADLPMVLRFLGYIADVRFGGADIVRDPSG